MRDDILILAAAAAMSTLPASASAERSRAGFASSGQFAASGVRIHRGRDGHHDRGRFDDFRRDRDRDRDFRGDTFFPYRDYQGDTLWRSDGFNDWWHDRPDRAFPRWVRHNQPCQRQYWAGGGWRC